MINKKLRKSIKTAEDKYSEADAAVQEVWKHIVFNGFVDEPTIDVCNGSNELILTYKGKELNANQIIDCMETKGFISKEDFI